MVALCLAAAGQHAKANRTIVIRKARARQEGDFKRMRRGGEDRHWRRMVAAGPPVPKIPQRRMTTLGSSVAEDQPFEGSPVPWFHIVGRTSLLSDTAGSHSAAPENNECAAQSSRNAAPLPGCEDSSPYKQRGASHSYGVLLRVCRSVVCPSGAFLKVQAKFSAPGIIRPESWTNSPGEPSGRLRNLLVRVRNAALSRA